MSYPANPAAQDNEVLLIVLKQVLDSMPHAPKQTILNSLETTAKKMQDDYVNAATGNKILQVVVKIK